MANKDRNPNSKKSESKKKTTNQKKLEQTTRIRIDQERLEDFDSLDTSFLEGRLEKKYRNNKKNRQKLFNTSENRFFSFVFFKIALLVVSIFCIVALFCFGLPSFLSKPKVEVKKDSPVSIKKEKVIDDNYLFVGDFHTENLSLEDFSVPTVKVCNEDYESVDILDHMRERIYQYNPSVVILEVGINDLKNKVSSDDILSNLEKIIIRIQDNRPYASIYVESVYPFNPDVSDYDEDYFEDDVSLDDIHSVNKKIKDLTKELDVSYIDISKVLSEDGKLNEKYTDDGIHLNDDGYQQVLKKIHEDVGDAS